MTNSNLDETKPTPMGDETIPTRIYADDSPIEGDTVATNIVQAGEPSAADNAPVLADSPLAEPPAEPQFEETGRSRAWLWLIILSLVSLLLIAAVSAWGGYRSGIEQRVNLQGTLVTNQVKEQFELGMQDFEAKHYEVARQRFEYVIQNNPEYPGVTDMLAAVLLAINTTATPTAVPTPTLTPTVDLRGADELFSHAQAALISGDWSDAIETLLRLRKNEPSYQTVRVDAMLYVALRNRGVQKILNEADLEGGTYDLALAERFGPLDVEANNYRLWADLYVTGVSFWGLDWEKAIYYFQQLLLVAPNLRDASNITATERYRLATIKYGDFLALSEKWCPARDQYDLALNFGPNPSLAPTATEVANLCEPPEEKTRPPQEPEATPTPTATLLPTDGPTVAPSPTTAASPTPGPPSPTPAPPSPTPVPPSPTPVPPSPTPVPPTATTAP